MPIKIYSLAESDIRFNRLESFDYSSPKAIVKISMDFYGLGQMMVFINMMGTHCYRERYVARQSIG